MDDSIHSDDAASKKYAALATQESALSEKWREHWLLSLSIANGSAVLLLLNNLGKPEWANIDMFVPSMSFLFGLAFSGAGRLVRAILHRQREQHFLAHGIVVDVMKRVGGDIPLHEEINATHARSVNRWRYAAIITEAMSALLFLLECGAAFAQEFAHRAGKESAAPSHAAHMVPGTAPSAHLPPPVRAKQRPLQTQEDAPAR
jgi:hypothetical protein